jgi:hypothetical protein
MADGELIDREEHLAACKERALRYWGDGDLLNAITSMGSDLDKHPETKCHPVLLKLGVMYAQHFDYKAVRDWIEGFR